MSPSTPLPATCTTYCRVVRRTKHIVPVTKVPSAQDYCKSPLALVVRPNLLLLLVPSPEACAATHFVAPSQCHKTET